MRVASGLDAGVGFAAGAGACDGGEDGARGEVDERVGAAAKGFGAAIDAQAIGMSREGFGDGDRGGNRVCRRHCLEESRK